jgi:hypothetical protein
MGSVAEQIVRHVPRSILVVPSHPAERIKRISQRAKKPRAASRVLRKRVPSEAERFTKRFRKIDKHPFPERRKTNKFRETASTY